MSAQIKKLVAKKPIKTAATVALNVKMQMKALKNRIKRK